MALNPWSEEESNDALDSLVSSGGVLEERLDEPLDYEDGFEGRRIKAALVLLSIWALVIGLHLVPWGRWFVRSLLLLLGLQSVRMIAAKPAEAPAPLTGDRTHWPSVVLMAAAKDEEAVIGRLVTDLCGMDYPGDRYEVWIIDDNSQDGTGEVLKRLQQDYPQLKVFRRPPNASGGKSGALNQVIPRTSGDFIAIFDADARVPPDLLRRTLPYFDLDQVGAVQVRKITASPRASFLVQGQSSEMMLDAYFQQQRTAIGGLGELRGNGQVLRRSALERCGGFNEETITDDLDLTLRLNLDGWDVAFASEPGVEEEGVTRWLGLWHQRNRWAEGGYQRYLDYWRLIADNRMGTNRSLEALGFLVIQYLLPMAMVPDALMALLLQRIPLLTPMSILSIGLPYIAMTLGTRRVYRQRHQGNNPPLISSLWRSVLGMVYLSHWFVVMASVTARMAFRKKHLKWVKTVHHGG